MNTETTTNRFFTKFTDLKDFKKKFLLTDKVKESRGLTKCDFFRKIFSTHSNLKTKDYTLSQKIISQNDIQIEDDWDNISFILSYIYFRGIHIATKVLINGELRIIYNNFSEEMKDFLKNEVQNHKQIFYYIKKLVRYCEANKIKNYKIDVMCDYTIPIFEEVETDEICCISLENEKPMIKTKCNHYFNRDNINEWLKKNHSCPLCRTPLQTSKKLKVYYKKYGSMPHIPPIIF